MSSTISALAATLLLLAGSRALAGPPSALEEMREAATAAAEVDPERVPPPRLLGMLPIRGTLEEVRRDAVRQAVRAEVNREWTDRAAGRGPATLSPGQGGQPPGQSVSAQARSAAAQAQDAAHNKDIAKERGRGRPDEPPGKAVGQNGSKGLR